MSSKGVAQQTERGMTKHTNFLRALSALAPPLPESAARLSDSCCFLESTFLLNFTPEILHYSEKFRIIQKKIKLEFCTKLKFMLSVW